MLFVACRPNALHASTSLKVAVGGLAGHAAALVQGGSEAESGGTVAVAGVVASPAGGVSLVASAAGVAVAVHGAFTLKNAIINLVSEAGSIYRVPGSATKSGKDYIGRHNKPNPQKTRKSNDGRDRTKAEVIDTYDPNKPTEGRSKEQQAIDEHGGVDNLDNKRNEIKKNPPPKTKSTNNGN